MAKELTRAEIHSQIAANGVAMANLRQFGSVLSPTERRDLLSKTVTGRAILQEEDAAAHPDSPQKTRSGLSESERREFLGATDVGRSILAADS